MKGLTQSLRVSGRVGMIDAAASHFTIMTYNEEEIRAYVSPETHFMTLRNTDKMGRDTSNPQIANPLERYLEPEQFVSAYGIMQNTDDTERFDIKSVTLFGNDKDNYLFEEGHWWLTQLSSFADIWLKRQFGLGSEFDFTGYRTDLTATGDRSVRSYQECDTIARLVYGLSSAYMLTGNRRYLNAAKAGVRYQRDNFRTLAHDGSFIIWHHAIHDGEKILPSRFPDDDGTIPLYEQIYALAGLAQYYRITQDWQTLRDIQRTVNFFTKFYRDPVHGGFYSHLDPATLTPDTSRLGDNRSKKNWNSVGDHTPAYLLNVLLALENIPEFADTNDEYKAIQKEMADLICDRFVDPECCFVNERFHKDWTPDQGYKWQQNRAVVGHNLKIAWNLTRAYHYLGDQRYLDVAEKIGDQMPAAGMDMIRGGWFDVVERCPKNGMPIDFAWHNRKAWWQQEQAILAYLILAGSTTTDQRRSKYLRLARESIAFWNLAFLDHDYGETYFDVLDNGYPFIYEDRANKGSHSKSGYHSMELNYLAHVYHNLLIAEDESITLYFRPCASRTVNVLNVLPDYLPRDILEIKSVHVNGYPYDKIDKERFQVLLREDHKGQDVGVAVRIGRKSQP